MIKKITSDTNLNQPIASLGNQAKHDKLVKEAAKAQEDSRTRVTDASDHIPGWEEGQASIARLSPPSSLSVESKGTIKHMSKSPEMHEYSVAESDAISKAQVAKTSKLSEKAKD